MLQVYTSAYGLLTTPKRIKIKLHDSSYAHKLLLHHDNGSDIITHN